MLRGAGRFTDDVAAPLAYHVAFVRSPVAAGAIRHIDVDEARACRAWSTWSPPRTLGTRAWWRPSSARSSWRPRCRLLAHDRVRYAGEPIVAVVAEDRYAAEDAADAVEVDIDEVPAVTSLAGATGDLPPAARRGPRRGPR